MLPLTQQGRAAQATRLARRLFVASSGIGLAVMACHDAPTAPIPELTPGREAMRITCEADVRRQVIACAPGDSAPPAGAAAPGMPSSIIFGTQGSTAKLTSSNVAYAGEVFSFNTTVQNLIGQKIGTVDGTTLAANGVRVFFNVWPYATSGSGTIDFINPGDAASLVDGYATFTAANQPYYQYNEVLATNQVSSAKLWRMHVPSTVLTFKFRVLIDAPVQYEDGWIDVSPAATQLRPTQATTLTGIVRDTYGATVTGAVIAWASNATGVATVNSSTGEVTAVADGQATITATSGLRSGSATITVAAPNAAQTTITSSPASPEAGSPATITVQVKSASGGNVTTSGDAVVLSADGGTLGSVSYAGNGQYTATLNSTSATTIHVTGTLNGTAIGNPATVTFVPGAPAAMSKQAGDNQSAGAGTAVATAPSVKVTDANGNAISGVSVTFAVGLGGGSVTGGSQTTNASGIATVGSWTLGTTPGTNNNTLVATAGSLSATFTASANGPAAIEIMAGDAQTAAVGAAVATAPSVRVKDASGTPLPGVTVTFAVTGGNGSVTSASTTTNASGIATVGSWTLGAGGASCSASAITSCTRNALSATATGGSTPSISFKGYVPPFVPSTATYQAVGNATLSIAAASGALKDAYSINGDGANGTGATLSVVSASATGSASGNVSFTQATGAFTYLSAAGYTNGAGTETFSYAVSDGRSATNTNATLAVNVPTRVWYVRPGFAGTSTGSETAPYKDFSATAGSGVEASGVSAASDVILVQTGSGTATGGTLKASQVVYGQGASAAYSYTFPGSAATYRNGGTSVTLLAAGSAPTVGALTLASGNTLRGVAISAASGTALSGSSFGTLTVSEASVTASSGAAIDLATGTLSGSFTAVNSTGGTNNVKLASVGTSGVFALGSGALSGASSDGFVVSGGAGTYTYSGTIANTASFAVNIASMTGGGVTLSGNVNPSVAGRGFSLANNSGGTFTFSGATQSISSGASAGVSLSNNTGATINFSGGGLAITTTTANGFFANGGGTISVTGSTNTVTSTTGTAVTVNNTTIGSSGLTFRSVSANGGANGIFLANTGSSGGLTVTGTGTVGSGGTIQNMVGSDGATSGIGVYASVSANLSLSNLNLTNAQNYGLRLASVSGTSSLTRLRITGTNGSSTGEASAYLTETTGSMTIQNSRIDAGYTNALNVVNTTGTLNRLTISQDTIGSAGLTTNADDALSIQAGAGTLNATIQNTKFEGAYRDMLQYTLAGSGTHDLVVQNNNFANGYGSMHATGSAIEIAPSGTPTPTFTYLITANTLTNVRYDVIQVDPGRATATGTISNNAIGTSGNVTSGSTGGGGIYVRMTGSGVHRSKISGNSIYGVTGPGAIHTGAGTGGSPGSGSMHLTISSNTIASLPGSGSGTASGYIDGLFFDLATTTGDTYTLCAQVGGTGAQNNLSGAFGGGSTGGGLPASVISNITGSTPVLKFSGYSAAGNSIPAALASRNTGFTSGDVYEETPNGTKVDATNIGTGATCNFIP